jgi:TrmH RNA methyltransferase
MENKKEERKYFGINACRAICKFRPEEVKKIYIDRKEREQFSNFFEWSRQRGVECKEVGEIDLEKLTKSTHHQGICVLAPEKGFFPVNKMLDHLERNPAAETILYLDGVENPHNLGAILRTAAHFGIRFIFGGREMPRLSPSACRTSEGASEMVQIVATDDSVHYLKKLEQMGFQIVLADVKKSKSLHQFRFQPKTVIVLGSEVKGISPALQELTEERVRIPGTGAVQSLNVSVSAAILLNEFQRQVAAAKKGP